jgi:DNA-binding MarR family transcriptional regulator
MQGIGDGYDLTPRARELLVFLSGREACPTFEEMRRALGLGSKSGVVRLLGQLEARGYVRRRKGCERAIVVLRGVASGDGIEALTPLPTPSPAQKGRGASVPAATRVPLPGLVPWFLAGIVSGGGLTGAFGALALALIWGGALLAIGARRVWRRQLTAGGGRHDRH